MFASVTAEVNNTEVKSSEYVCNNIGIYLQHIDSFVFDSFVSSFWFWNATAKTRSSHANSSQSVFAM